MYTVEWKHFFYNRFVIPIQAFSVIDIFWSLDTNYESYDVR